MSFWDIVANLRLEMPTGNIAVIDGRTLYRVERLDHDRQYMLRVLRAIVDQLDAPGAGAR